MFNVQHLKPTELSKYKNVSRSAITQKFRKSEECERLNNRLLTIPPHLVEKELAGETNKDLFNKFLVCMSSNIVGGCAKTSSILSYGASLKRVSTMNVVFIDSDPQASLSTVLCGNPKDLDQPVLVDYFEGKATLKEIIEEIDKGVYVIRGSLNNCFLDRAVSQPKQIKTCGLNLLEEIKEMLGEKTAVCIDTPPQIGNFLNTMIVAMGQMDSNTKRIILNPMRSDSFALNGSVMLKSEIEDSLNTWSLPKDSIEVISFFSSFDRRVNSSKESYRMAMTNDILKDSLSPVAIRYSSEMTKSLNKNENIFATKDGAKSAGASDYMDLMFFSLDYNGNEGTIQ